MSSFLDTSLRLDGYFRLCSPGTLKDAALPHNPRLTFQLSLPSYPTQYYFSFASFASFLSIY